MTGASASDMMINATEMMISPDPGPSPTARSITAPTAATAMPVPVITDGGYRWMIWRDDRTDDEAQCRRQRPQRRARVATARERAADTGRRTGIADDGEDAEQVGAQRRAEMPGSERGAHRSMANRVGAVCARTSSRQQSRQGSPATAERNEPPWASSFKPNTIARIASSDIAALTRSQAAGVRILVFRGASAGREIAGEP